MPLIDFDLHHYIFPQLYFEIGTVNNLLDALKSFIEEEEDMLSEAEVEARNAKIRKFSEEERDSLQTQWQELDNEIEAFSQEQKRLKADASGKRKTFLESSKALKEEQAKKTKLDRPATAIMENILSKYEISPARYHGGKLNGVDCREFMSKAKDICSEIQAMLLSVDHPQRCSDENIIDRCSIYCKILVTLDLISSKIRIKQGH